MGIPFLEYWVSMLTDPSTEPDLTYQKLHLRLKAISNLGATPEEAIARWIRHAEQVSSVYEELALIYFRTIRQPKYIGRGVRPEVGLVLFSNYFRSILKREIANNRDPLVDAARLGDRFPERIHEDGHTDHLLIKNLNLSIWESYLLEIMRYSPTGLEISRRTHLIYNLGIKCKDRLWYKLNDSFSTPEL